MQSGTSSTDVEVFRGSQPASVEFGLVLDSQGFAYERIESAGSWALFVTAEVAPAVETELRRYAAERTQRRQSPPFQIFAGARLGAAVYAAVLISIAYCASVQLFGVAWLAILLAASAANTADMLLSPPWQRAVGASNAVFAALGLLTGFGWGQRVPRHERRLYRWAPLFGGVCLFALLGSGGEHREHVDVLGHMLGFGAGMMLGVVFARWRVPRNRNATLQGACGSIALSIIVAAWLLALRHAG